ncbi:MAG: PQQ-binding-like beta-propeller repeat protein [Candidatus Bilamarchaeaceae archaeon]
MGRKYFLWVYLFLLLSSLSFSALAWEQNVGGKQTTEPIMFHDKIAIASSDDKVYLIEPTNGKVVWKTPVEDAIQLIEYGGKLIVFGRNGKVTAIDRDGKNAWTYDFGQFNVTTLYGAGKNSKGMYVATDKGIFRLVENNAIQIYSKNDSYTRPAVEESFIIFGVGKNIAKIDLNGNVLWTRELDKPIWKSYPIVSGQAVYFGALDNKFYAFTISGGHKIWEVVTGGWIIAPAIIDRGIVYFASNDGYLYAANSESGSLLWKKRIGTAVMSGLNSGIIGDKSAVFAGGTDGTVRALSEDNGKFLWEATAMSRVGKPIIYRDLLIFGSDDGYTYAYNMERTCSIQSPSNGERFGYKEVVISGTSVSRVGEQRVFISINNGEWIETIASEEEGTWAYYLNPQTELNEGMNTISCKVIDMGGEESGVAYPTVNVIRDSTIPLDSFTIIPFPSKPLEGEPFVVFVNSNSDGLPVNRFTLRIKETGNEYTGDKNITLRINTAGRYTIEVTKIGYNKGVTYVEVVSKEINPLYLIIGGVLLLIVLWQLYEKIISKKLRREKV